MRAPSWETSAGALAALLNSGAPLLKADIYRVKLRNGTIYRWSGGDVALQVAGNLYTLGPGIRRTRVRWQVGIQTDTMTLTLTDIAGDLFNGQTLAAFVRAGGFDGAELRVEKVFWGVASAGPVGSLHWFTGFIDDADGSRHEAELRISSFTKLLDVLVPGPIYGTQCANTVFDAVCGLAASTFTVNGSATTATNSFRNTFGHGLAQAAGWFSLGRITMTSGANVGITRTCKQHTSTQLIALQPWPFAVAPGDTFAIVAGCDNLPTTCTSKFNNRLRYRGQPLIPVPETTL